MEIVTTVSDSFDSDTFMEPADELQKNTEQNTSWSMEI